MSVPRRATLSRRFLVPEVIQTSGMDCGVASVKAIVDGFGIDVSYGRLREACQTDVDGTSITVMERLINALGVAAKQIILPVDHVLLHPERVLPAIAVVRLPNGFTHFVVAWRTHRGVVQVMDPARGRRWPASDAFTRQLFVHRARVTRAQWHAWASTRDYLDLLERRMAALAVSRRDRLIADALLDTTGSRIAHLDAAVRMTTRLARARALPRRSGGSLIERLLDEEPRPASAAGGSIPADHWFVAPVDNEKVAVSGAVLIRVDGLARALEGGEATPASAAFPNAARLLAGVEQRPGNQLWRAALSQRWRLALPAIALALVTVGGIVEALLLRGVLDLGTMLAFPQDRLVLLAAIPLLMLFISAAEAVAAASVFRIGNILEAQVRALFLQKIPRVANRFLKSRLMSDMAERCQAIARLRLFPPLIAQGTRLTFELVATGAVIVWMDPRGWPTVAAAVVLSLLLPLVVIRLLAERDLRVRNLNGAMIRFYLDSLRGLLAIRTHGGERALCREHETLLVDWRSAVASLNRTTLVLDAILATAGTALVAVLLFGHFERWDQRVSTILLLYWALNLPQLGQELALLSRQYPSQRNVMLRLLEVLSAPEEHRDNSRAAGAASAPGVHVAFKGIQVVAGGHVLLDDVTIDIAPGRHVGVIGRSGAGKSTLLGLLLGWHRPARGAIAIDGGVADDDVIRDLRQQTAWVDPTVQLWNTTLLDNLTYGAAPQHLPMDRIVADADLQPVLVALPKGFQQELGDSGSLLSGGEGQRVRVGRAMNRPEARLVLLDEAFRGLTREQRRTFLSRARRWWPRATMLCATHDVPDTLGLDYVLLVDRGKVVEQGEPAALAANPDSLYRRMLDADASARDNVWGDAAWIQLAMRDGRVDAREARP